MDISLSQASRDCLSEGTLKDRVIKIYYPGHKFHEKEARVFHDYGDGRLNVQLRHSEKKGDVTNLTLHRGQYIS